VQIALLGSPSIVIDQHPLKTLRRMNQALVFYLAARPAPYSRDQILAFFWPDTPRPAAQQTLRSMLYELRRSLPPGFILSEADRLALGEEVEIDARAFTQALSHPAVDPGELASILKLYRGDFLDGFALDGTPAFDDWVEIEREHYRTQAIRRYGELSRLYSKEHKFPAAMDALETALDIDPLQEDLQRECLRLQYLLGDRAGAIRRYEALTRLLGDELGVPPMPETRALYDAIITDRLPRAGPDQPEPREKAPAVQANPGELPQLPFTGRKREIEILTAARASMKLALVEGAPGLGKTRLVEEYLARQQHDAGRKNPSLAVLKGVAHELEQSLPYQPVMDALRGLLRRPEWDALIASLDLAPVWKAELAHLVPEFGSRFPKAEQIEPVAGESRAWEAIHQFLRSLAQRGQVVLFLDDLHWADSSTVGLVAYLARRIDTPAVQLIGTSRPVTPQSKQSIAFNALIHENVLERINLSPLTDADTAAIAGAVSPSDPGRLPAGSASMQRAIPTFSPS
jgi:DNA-binding SARP family transcriptional activator